MYIYTAMAVQKNYIFKVWLTKYQKKSPNVYENNLYKKCNSGDKKSYIYAYFEHTVAVNKITQ